MSWYNNTSSDFQDATQQFLGGGGGSSVTIINEGDTIINGGNTGEDTTISDIIDLRLDYLENDYENPNASLTYNLYLKNNNVGGEIRFYTPDSQNNNDVSNNSLKYNSSSLW